MAHIFTDAENIAWQKTLSGKVSSACVIYVRDECVLMVKANYKNRWTFPGGVVDEGESPLAAAVRESREEIGFDPGRDNLQFVTAAYAIPRGGYQDHVKYVVRSLVNPDDENITLQEEEIEEYKWVPFDEVTVYAHKFGIYTPIVEYLTGASKVPGFIEI